MKNHKPDINSQ